MFRLKYENKYPRDNKVQKVNINKVRGEGHVGKNIRVGGGKVTDVRPLGVGLGRVDVWRVT